MSLGSHGYLRSFLLVMILLFSLVQAQESTPYSRFGLGYTGDYNFVPSQSIGGMGATYRSAEGINFNNPASYAQLRLTSFEAGIYGTSDVLKTSTLKDSRGTGGLSYLAVSFPINKYWGSSVGLIPFSKKDYSLTDTTSFGDPNGDIAVKEFEGSGTIYNLYWGNGFKYKDLAIGFNFIYLFGKLNNNSLAYPLDSTLLPDKTGNTTWKYNNLNTKGIMFNLGAQYRITIKDYPLDDTRKRNPISLVIGISGSPGSKIGKLSKMDEGTNNFNSSQFYSPTPRSENQGIQEFINQNLNFSVVDTLKEALNQATQVKIPGSLDAGVMFEQGVRWKSGVDFRYQPWKNYQGYENNGASVLQNSWRLGLGGEFLPSDRGTGKYGKRIKYRAGVNFGQSHIIANSTSIKEYGVNVGFGLPITNAISDENGYIQKVAMYTFNLGFEVGGRGTTNNDLLKETYFRFKLGFNFSDRWFVKRKLN